MEIVKPKQLSELTVQEAKAQAYDHLSMIERLQLELREINKHIATLSQPIQTEASKEE